MVKKGRLILIPSLLSEDNSDQHFPEATRTEIYLLKTFIVERAKTARRFLRAIGYKIDFEEVDMKELNKHGSDDIDGFLAPCEQGVDVGLISEAGAPGIADPGGSIVLAAHHKGIKVVPLIGASSILQALMASGMNGQHFQFHGYLPRDQNELGSKIKELESESFAKSLTQIFIETPYRNDKMFQVLLKVLKPETLICLASNLTSMNEKVMTKPVAEWKKGTFEIGKSPTVFLVYSGKIFE